MILTQTYQTINHKYITIIFYMYENYKHFSEGVAKILELLYFYTRPLIKFWIYRENIDNFLNARSNRSLMINHIVIP